MTPESPAPLVVLYEDNHCLALSKPAPLLTQAPPGIPSLEARAKAYLRDRYGKKGNVYLGIPHRLDRPVTGVVLFARNTKAARRLAEQFRERQVRKTYWAAVEGAVGQPEGTWEDWLVKFPEEARAECAAAFAPGARRAVLRYRLLGLAEGVTLLDLRPETGRMHQIRVQAAAHGCPVVGDALYGAGLPFGPPAALPRDRIIALHARALMFRHPIRYEPIVVEAPVPQPWFDLLDPAIVRLLPANELEDDYSPNGN